MVKAVSTAYEVVAEAASTAGEVVAAATSTTAHAVPVATTLAAVGDCAIQVPNGRLPPVPPSRDGRGRGRDPRRVPLSRRSNSPPLGTGVSRRPRAGRPSAASGRRVSSPRGRLSPCEAAADAPDRRPRAARFPRAGERARLTRVRRPVPPWPRRRP